MPKKQRVPSFNPLPQHRQWVFLCLKQRPDLMNFEVWQLSLGAGVLLVAISSLIVTIIQMHNARYKELEGRHDRLVGHHHAHIKEVADKYAKKVYVNERLESLDRQVIASLNHIKELIELKLP